MERYLKPKCRLGPLHISMRYLGSPLGLVRTKGYSQQQNYKILKEMSWSHACISPFCSWSYKHVKLRTELWIGNLPLEVIYLVVEIITCFFHDLYWCDQNHNPNGLMIN